jgi:hypothetical protein
MLKRDITYEDLDGETITETFYFNLNKVELVELEVEHRDGLREAMMRIIKSNDRKEIVAEFQKIILMSYGVRADDGKAFLKSDELRKKFSQSLAYPELFMELATNEESAATFINGIMPKGFVEEMEKAAAENGSQPAIMPKVPTTG